jgi:hypothetical protein
MPGVRAWATFTVQPPLLQWVRHRKNQVATWELLAAICVLEWVLRRQKGELEVCLFVDNTNALSTLLRGSSRQPDWNDLVGDLWLRVARSGLLFYCLYVPSHMNMADAPSRPGEKQRELEDMRRAGFAQVSWETPPDAPWPQ